MAGRSPLKIKKAILEVLKDGKSHSYAELEKKVRGNWQSIRNHCKELEIFDWVEIKKKQSHEVNNKPYFEVVIKKNGLEILKTV